MFRDTADAARGENVKRGKDGLWAVRFGTDQYAAWKFWLVREFGTTFFPEWLTVRGEWPPTTQNAASAIASAISDIRDELKIIHPVSRNPAPWDGYIPAAPITQGDEPK